MKKFLFDFVLLVLCSSAFAAQTQKLSPEFFDPRSSNVALRNQALAARDALGRVNVIIQYTTAPTSVQHQRVINRGGLLRSELRLIHGAVYSMPLARVPEMQAYDDVAYISTDRKLVGLLDNTAGAVQVQAAWQAGWDGTGIGVAVLDSGISNHDDLSGGSRIVYRQDFTGQTTTTLQSGGSFAFNPPTTDDLYGHGEHVAGIIAGNGQDSNCNICTRHLVGMAPNANLLDLRVLDSNGESSDSTVIAAIYQAIQLKNQYNIKVMNLSLGRPVYESYQQDPLCLAVEAAWQAGIVVVVAAGNYGRDNSVGESGYGTITAPGNDPYVITVGAMKTMGTPNRSDDLIASYSSKGPTAIDHIVKPDLVAPGNLVVSLLAPDATLPTLFPQNLVALNYYQATSDTSPSQQYFLLSGTSMAAPVVSGAAALLLEAEPGLTPDQVKAKFMRTAYKTFPLSSTAYDPTTGQSYTSEYDIFTIGAGYLDIQAALADNTPFSGTALSPTAVFHPLFDPNDAFIVCDDTTVCSQQSVWPNQSLWSTQAIWGTQCVWPNLAIWGDQSLWGTQSVWATQSLWGTQSPSAAVFTNFLELTDIAVKGEN